MKERIYPREKYLSPLRYFESLEFVTSKGFAKAFLTLSLAARISRSDKPSGAKEISVGLRPVKAQMQVSPAMYLPSP